MQSRRILAACSVLAMACGSLVDPPLPVSAEQFAAPPIYAQWWAITEACSGIIRPLDAVTFYRVPNTNTVPDGSRGEAAGYWSLASNRIVLAGSVVDDGSIVRHEMLHALLRADGHAPDYFQGRCAGAVSCDDVVCRNEGTEPVRAPVGAPALPLTELELNVGSSPSDVGGSAADRLVSVVVRASNPRTEPVLVPLEATPDVPGHPTYAGFFGFAIRRVGADSVLMGMQQSVPRAPAGFAAGETRWSVFDLDLRSFPPGDYSLTGMFNTRRVTTTIRIEP